MTESVSARSLYEALVDRQRKHNQLQSSRQSRSGKRPGTDALQAAMEKVEEELAYIESIVSFLSGMFESQEWGDLAEIPLWNLDLDPVLLRLWQELADEVDALECEQDLRKEDNPSWTILKTLRERVWVGRALQGREERRVIRARRESHDIHQETTEVEVVETESPVQDTVKPPKPVFQVKRINRLPAPLRTNTS